MRSEPTFLLTPTVLSPELNADTHHMAPCVLSARNLQRNQKKKKEADEEEERRERIRDTAAALPALERRQVCGGKVSADLRLTLHARK